MARNHYPVVWLFLALFSSTSMQQSCYAPNGALMPKLPQISWSLCSNGKSQTCCITGDACMSNNLCFGAGIGVVYRGGCSDPNWSDPLACPTQYCNHALPGTWSNFWRCPASTGAGFWCGNEDKTQPCQRGSDAQLFNLDWHDVRVAVVEAGQAASSSSPSGAAQAPTSTGITNPAPLSPQSTTATGPTGSSTLTTPTIYNTPSTTASKSSASPDTLTKSTSAAAPGSTTPSRVLAAIGLTFSARSLLLRLVGA